MQKNVRGAIFVETDLLAEFLLCGDPPSKLRRMLTERPCFTGFVQAAELLACASNKKQQAIIDRVLCGVKILGMHARYAEAVASILREESEPERLSFRDATVLAMVREARLPIATIKHRAKFEPLCEIATIDEI